MTEETIYKVIVQGSQKLITMPKESGGYYLRKVCQDGAVTFLPVKMPGEMIVPPAVPVLEVEHGRLRSEENPEMMK